MSLLISDMPRTQKRLILLGLDTVILCVAYALSFVLRIGTFTVWVNYPDMWIMLAFVAGLGMAVIWATALNRYKLSTFDNQAIARAGLVSIIMVVVAAMVGFVSQLWLPRSVPFIFGILFFGGVVGSRLLMQSVLMLSIPEVPGQRMLIYGAGAAGIQLAGALEQTGGVRLIGFIDDSKALQGTLVKGLRIWCFDQVERVVQRRKVDVIALAIPSLSEAARQNVLRRLSALPVKVQTLPSFQQLLGDEDPIKVLRPIRIEDLLGRATVDLNLPEVAETYRDKVVLVTGAGGSIGSELCTQLIDCGVAKIIAYDHAELSLYALDERLRHSAAQAGIALITRLGSVLDDVQVRLLIERHGVQVVMHAAAYKHVPLVEDNELAGLRNNVLGTQIVAKAAVDLGVERFTLISTDKAVRPTNIMGASKRLAEIVVQDLAKRSEGTIYSMVRFGNVLGSSGSVIPLFERQIAKGGPVTVTHAEVTRYFMTIAEASRLVLLAGCYSNSGDVFLLDMGRPVKIIDLARDMIRLAGRTIRSTENPEGDIRIEVTGLRPGEKLFEELLIGGSTLPTQHPKILRSVEMCLSEVETRAMLKDLQSALGHRDNVKGRLAVKRWVEGYQDNTEQVHSEMV